MLKASGYTLISLMIGLAVASALLSAALLWARTSLTTHQLVLKTTAMEDELSRLIQLMRSQIRRAGYDGLTATRLLSQKPRSDSPFYPAFTINAHPEEMTDSCILFHYDKNHNGVKNAQHPSEQMGFRLRQQAIEYRMSNRLCHSSGWHDLTSVTVLVITHLEFKFIPMPDQSNGAFVLITLRAALKHSPDIQRTLTTTVTVRNF